MPQGHHRHENKRDKSLTRNIQSIRRDKENGILLEDKPMPLVDIGVSKITKIIASVINPSSKDVIREAWLKIIKEHPNNEQDILDIALEVNSINTKRTPEIRITEKTLINNSEDDENIFAKPTNQFVISKLKNDVLVSGRLNNKYNILEDTYLLDVPLKHKYYELNGDNHCPRCFNGVIVQDGHDKICLCCGLRDYIFISPSEFIEEVLINWLIDNKPRQLFTPPKNC